jgi:two-component system, OmpR family, sensor kinase
VEILPRIFERFVTGTDSLGLGLGLYLARQVAAAHGGELSVESPPGKGARFRLELPIQQEV